MNRIVVLTAAVLVVVAGQAAARPAARPTCFGKPATIVGKAGADIITGTKRADVIAGLGGADRINGGGGNDLICGGLGNDIVYGGTGADRIDGGAGFDTCRTAERLAGCEETRPGLPYKGAVAPGVYVTDLFAPHFSIQLGTGWYSGGESPGEGPFEVDLFHGPKSSGSPGIVFDSTSAGRSVAEAVALVAAEPALNASAPTPVTVAGHEGQRVEIAVTPNLGRFVRVPSMSRAVGLPSEYRGRLDTISLGTKTVVILTVAPPGEYEGFLPVADQALATVQFRP
jgi:hypothetical protein